MAAEEVQIASTWRKKISELPLGDVSRGDSEFVVQAEEANSKVSLPRNWFRSSSSCCCFFPLLGFLAFWLLVFLAFRLLAGLCGFWWLFGFGCSHPLHSQFLFGRWRFGFCGFLLVYAAFGGFGFSHPLLSQFLSGLFGFCTLSLVFGHHFFEHHRGASPPPPNPFRLFADMQLHP